MFHIKPFCPITIRDHGELAPPPRVEGPAAVHCFGTSHNPDPPPSQSAAAYIEEHNIQKVVEEVINATIKAKPSNPFSFMVR